MLPFAEVTPFAGNGSRPLQLHLGTEANHHLAGSIRSGGGQIGHKADHVEGTGAIQ